MLYSSTKSNLVIPASGENLAYFRWTIPSGMNLTNVTMSAEILVNGISKTVRIDQNAVIGQNKSITPDTRFEKSAPTDFLKINPPYSSGITSASWSEWVYESNTFIKKTYGLSLKAGTLSIVPDVNSPSRKYTGGLWYMGSGYGFTVSWNTQNSGISGTLYPLSTAYTAAQVASIFLPEYKYSGVVSKNVTWGIRNSFKNGNVPFRYNQMLGYEKGDDGKPKIVPEEAEVVKKIFKLYLDGSSLVQIKQLLESEEIKTVSGKIEWTQGGLKYILQNEKYVGDALLQKSYVTDFISKKAKKNNGELPKYLVSNHHEAIIDRDTFNRVQEEMARRTSKRKVSDKTTTEQGRYSSKYALTELMMCGNCGSPYRRITWYRDGNKKVVWRCLNRVEHGTKYCKDSPSFDESLLHGAIVKALNSLSDDKNEIIPVLKYSLSLALQGKDEDGISIYTLEQRIKELNRCMMDMVVLSAKSGASEEKFDEEFKKISDEINALKELLKTNKCKQSKVENESSRLNEIFELIEKEDFSIKEYNDILTRQFIECIKVISSLKLLVIFKGGMEMEVEI